MPQVVSLVARKPEKRNKFRSGAVVQLRSGGPAMTIEKPGPEKSECVWFDDIGNDVCVRTFLNYLLCKYVEPAKGEK